MKFNEYIHGKTDKVFKRTADEILQIKELYSRGYSMRGLARIYHYKSHKSISDIIHGKRKAEL